MPPPVEQFPLRDSVSEPFRDVMECSLPERLDAEGILPPVVRVVRHVVAETGRQMIWAGPKRPRGYVESVYVSLTLDGLYDSGVLDPRVLRLVLLAMAEGLLAPVRRR